MAANLSWLPESHKSLGRPAKTQLALSILHTKHSCFHNLVAGRGEGVGVPVCRRGYKPSPRCLRAPEECIKGAPEPTINTAMPAQRHTHTGHSARQGRQNGRRNRLQLFVVDTQNGEGERRGGGKKMLNQNMHTRPRVASTLNGINLSKKLPPMAGSRR